MLNRFVFFRQTYGFDVRSIELFRIGFGITLLVDLFWRFIDLEIHYTDFGVLPRSILIDKYLSPWNFSLHLFNGTSLITGFLFLIAAGFAVCLILGFHTRFAAVMSWVFLISIQNRNHMVLQGGDVFFRMLAFWAMFLPMGRLFSIDLKQGRVKAPIHPEYFSIGTMGMMIQIAVVYICSGLIKYAQPSWQEGNAMYFAFATDQYNTFISRFLLDFPNFLEVLDYITLATESVLPLLLLLPIRGAKQRLLVCIIFCSFHIVVAGTLTVGLFSLIGFTAWLVLFPGVFWNLVEKKYPKISINSLLSHHTELATPSVWKVAQTWIVEAFCVFSIFIIVWWNLPTIPLSNVKKGPPFQNLAIFFRWDQTWNMFSAPIIEDGWYVIPGVLKNGKVVDLWNDGEPLSWLNPENYSATYKRQRVKKYMLNIYSAGNQDHRLYFGRYLCRLWNREHADSESLQSFRIIYMREDNLRNKIVAPVQRIVTWNHECFDGALKTYVPPQ